MFKEMCSEQRQWRRSGVFTACSNVSIVNFEHVIADWEFINIQQILHIVVVFPCCFWTSKWRLGSHFRKK